MRAGSLAVVCAVLFCIRGSGRLESKGFIHSLLEYIGGAARSGFAAELSDELAMPASDRSVVRASFVQDLMEGGMMAGMSVMSAGLGSGIGAGVMGTAMNVLNAQKNKKAGIVSVLTSGQDYPWVCNCDPNDTSMPVTSRKCPDDADLGCKSS